MCAIIVPLSFTQSIDSLKQALNKIDEQMSESQLPALLQQLDEKMEASGLAEIVRQFDSRRPEGGVPRPFWYDLDLSKFEPLEERMRRVVREEVRRALAEAIEPTPPSDDDRLYGADGVKRKPGFKASDEGDEDA